MVGKPPFETNSLRETYAKIKRCEYYLPPNLSEPAACMLHQMLLPEPSRRPTVSQLMEMTFMKGYCPKELPLSCLTMAPRFDALKESNNRRPLLEVNSKYTILIATPGYRKDVHFFEVLLLIIY